MKNFGKYAPIFVLPVLIAFVIAFVVPFFFGIYLSFSEFTTVGNARFVGLQNYIEVFTNSGDFLNSLWFTVRFTSVTVLLVNVVAFFLAILLTRGLRGTNFFRTFFYMPNLIGGIVLGYVWQLILNGILSYSGLDITFSSRYGFWGLVIVSAWQMIGYMMIIYIAGIQNIPREMHEVASIDGANAWQTLRYVVLPLVAPAITICTFLTLTNAFKMFDQNLALTGGAPARETEMLALNIYNTFYGRVGSEGVGQAKAVIFFLLASTFAALQLRLTRNRELTE